MRSIVSLLITKHKARHNKSRHILSISEDSSEEEVEIDPVESCGCDVLADVPSEDEADCVDVEFQFSSKPHLSSYYIRASRDDMYALTLCSSFVAFLHLMLLTLLYK